MPLEPGTSLGPYSVTAKIGEGGMGEVYRARDTKLDRDVALKVLPEAFTDDPDRLARFEREAKVLASLNHPNIGHIYGLEEAEGTRALVLELIEGPTLADRIAQGPIPIGEALTIAKQIAEALEAAHEAGVIHRDLKPANIKVREDGTVKVLDFGLAKALDTTPEGDPSQSPTLTAAATQMGVIMGTAAYMSPEQARGSVADSRADVWSFGVVLYEMLTGTRLFDGATVSDTLASVLKTEPDWRVLSGDVPASVRKLLRRCLSKERKARLQHVGDARVEIDESLAAPSDDSAEVHLAPKPAGWRQALPWVAGIGVGVVVAALAMWTFIQPPDLLATRFTIEPPPGVRFGLPLQVISPDGRTVAFQGLNENGSQVYLRSLDQLEAVPLRGAESAGPMGFSPDGQSLLVLDTQSSGLLSATGNVKRVALTGGPTTTVTQGNGGTAWGPDDTFVHGSNVGLMLIRGSGGEATPLTTLTEGETGHFIPRFLPSGRAVLFYAYGGGGPAASQIAVVDLETGVRTNLLPGTSPSFATTGHLVFWRDDSLWAVPFNPDPPEVTGAPVVVVESLRGVGADVASYGLADNGTLVYRRAGGEARATLGWVNREGVMTTPLIDGFRRPRLSFGGTRIVFERQAGNLWILDLESGRETRLTDGGGGASPVWTPDDTTVTFMGNRGDGNQLYARPVDRSSETELVLSTEFNSVPASWTLDEQTLVYVAVNAQGDRDIWRLPVGGDPVPFLVTEFDEKEPRLSPNGKWLAYTSDQPGEDRIFVQAFPEGGRRFSISTGPGTEGVWSRDGRELFYRNGNQMWVVDVETEAEFAAGRSELLFEAPYLLDGSGNASYDVSVDGQQFLMVQQSDTAYETSPLTVVLNWFEELTRLVPTI